MLEHVVRNYSPWEGPTLEQVMEDCLLCERPNTGAGKECEEEGVPMRDELTTAHIPCPSVLVGRRRQRKSGVKLSSGRREG